jgi:surface polysaccharide O-acyltransferase-like enzyme
MAQQHTLALSVLNSLFIPAVNIFILISGYFSIKPKVDKVLKLVLTLAFYTLLLNVPYNLYAHQYYFAVKNLLLFTELPYWFVINYLVLICFAPMINHYLESLTHRQFKWFVAILLVISCYCGLLLRDNVNLNGYTFFQFIMMYVIGRYIRRYEVQWSRKASLLTYIGCSICIGGLMYMLYQMGRHEAAWCVTFYNNPLVMLSAIAVFQLFKSFHIQSRVINSLAVSAFSIYLVQSSALVEHWHYKIIGGLTGSLWYVMAVVVVLAVAIAAVALLVDRLQLLINDKVRGYLVRKCSKLLRISK